MGWPGTQTKDGHTVEIKQTFSESDTSGMHRPPSSAGGGGPATPSSSVGRSGGMGGSGQWIDAGDVMDDASDESDLVGDDDLPRQPQITQMENNPADFHLAAALADVGAAAPPASPPQPTSSPASSPIKPLRPSAIDAPPYRSSRSRDVRNRSQRDGSVRMQKLSNANGTSAQSDIFDDDNEYIGEDDAILNVGSPFRPPSPSSKSKRKQLPVAGGGTVPDGIDISGSASRVLASGRSPVTSPEKAAPRSRSSPAAKNTTRNLPPEKPLTSSRSTASQPLSEAALREQEKRLPLPERAGKINARNVRGYRGFFDKTRDVPNLMDADAVWVPQLAAVPSNKADTLGISRCICSRNSVTRFVFRKSR